MSLRNLWEELTGAFRPEDEEGYTARPAERPPPVASGGGGPAGDQSVNLNLPPAMHNEASMMPADEAASTNASIDNTREGELQRRGQIKDYELTEKEYRKQLDEWKADANKAFQFLEKEVHEERLDKGELHGEYERWLKENPQPKAPPPLNPPITGNTTADVHRSNMPPTHEEIKKKKAPF